MHRLLIHLNLIRSAWPLLVSFECVAFFSLDRRHLAPFTTILRGHAARKYTFLPCSLAPRLPPFHIFVVKTSPIHHGQVILLKKLWIEVFHNIFSVRLPHVCV